VSEMANVSKIIVCKGQLDIQNCIGNQSGPVVGICTSDQPDAVTST